MSRFLELCQYAETRRIDIDYFPLGCLETLSMPVCGANAIAIDPAKNLSRNKCICGIMPKGDENDRKEELSSMDNFR